MKRNLIIAVLVVFAFSSIFLLSSCAKKQVVTEEKVTKAPPAEAAEIEKEKPAVKEAEVKPEEKAEVEPLKEAEKVEEKKVEAKFDEEKAWRDRMAAKVEAEPIYFDFDKSFIRQEYRPILYEKAGFLKDSPDTILRIEGNCDERGTNEYNLALGERRANSAKNFLVSLGISPERIETISYGEERPLALGHNESSWAQNRRDDFVLTWK